MAPIRFLRLHGNTWDGRSAPAHACPDSWRQFGRVRKCIDKNKRAACFQFRRQGVRITLDGPTRAFKADAEDDRKSVAEAASQSPRSLRADAASIVVGNLRSGAVTISVATPGSVSLSSLHQTKKLSEMDKTDLRLATRTPGISRNRKLKMVNGVPKL